MVPCQRCAVPCDEAHRFCFACGAELAPPTSQEDPLIGRTLPGGYRVTHLVGVGGMGRVYCAEQVALGRTVAVKVVHPSLARRRVDGGAVPQRGARRESAEPSELGRDLRLRSHRRRAAVHRDGVPARARPRATWPPTKARCHCARLVDVLRQTLGALEEAHALGIVHRDLKPDNIVLEPLRSGLDFVKVVDFGLAKILEEDAHGQERRAGASRGPASSAGRPST